MTDHTEKPAERLEIRVPESDTKDLTLFDRSDIIFAVLYSILFLWGLILSSMLTARLTGVEALAGIWSFLPAQAATPTLAELFAGFRLLASCHR